MKKPFHKEMTRKAPLYIYATEMVSSYYSLLQLQDKKVLSIVGSGDQIINAYFYGAKEALGFDINKYSFFMLDIKFEAIINLSRDEFLHFFGTSMSNASFDFNLYSKLRNNLSSRTKSFFDKTYKEFNNNGKELAQSKYFRQRSIMKTSVKDINVYLKSDKDYFKCRDIIRNKKKMFYQLDINNISSDKNLKGKFDIINLSNVLNYLTDNTKEENLLMELLKVTKNINKKIKANGLFFYYSYSPSIYKSMGRSIPSASRIQLIREIQEKSNFKISTKRFKGMHKNTLDRINIFRV